MKSYVRKIICALLCMCMLASFIVPAYAAGGSPVPIVYCQGQGVNLYGADGKQIYPEPIPDGYILDAVKVCMPTFLNALKTDEWEEYKTQLESYVLPVVGGYALDKNGEASDGSYVAWSWNRSKLKTSGPYFNGDYIYHMDWRLDPFANARILKSFIDDIISVTGSSKVNLVGRCEGSNVIMAYLAEYGYEKINCIEFYCHAILGVDAVGSIFSGKFRVNADAVNRYYSDNSKVFEDEILRQFLDATIELATETYGLSLAGAGFELILKKVYDEVLGDIILETYGSMPGIWCLVGPGDYAEARKNLLDGKEDEYAGLIEKIDNYDVKVRSRTYDLLKEASDSGIKFANYAKYGFQLLPLSYTNNEQADNAINLRNSALGATTTHIGKTFSKSYLAKAEANGTSQYISPDNVCDASTCLFPDTTWIIYKSEHKYFPDSIHNLMFQFFVHDGNMTVFSDENYPQYMIYDAETDSVSPMTKADVPEKQEDTAPTKTDYKNMAINFIVSLVNFLLQVLGFGMRVSV